MTYKLTVDVNLMDPSLKIPGMDTLRRWTEEGKIELAEADRAKNPAPPSNSAYNWPGAGARTEGVAKGRSSWGGPKGRPGKIKDSGNASFSSIAGVLFPTKDPHKLNMTEINDVAHLVMHHSSLNKIFVTANTKDFIEEGRRERLKQSFGIIAMTPAEAVKMLSELEGWDGPKLEAAAPNGGGAKAKKAAKSPAKSPSKST